MYMYVEFDFIGFDAYWGTRYKKTNTILDHSTFTATVFNIHCIIANKEGAL